MPSWISSRFLVIKFLCSVLIVNRYVGSDWMFVMQNKNYPVTLSMKILNLILESLTLIIGE